MEKQRYQVNQDNQEYILLANLMGNKINIECQDNNFSSLSSYDRGYSLQRKK